MRVWLQPYGDGIGLLSHDIGPDLERFYGSDEIETFLVIERQHLDALTTALRAERTDADAPTDAISLLADEYAGSSTATSDLRTWLTQHAIPSRFSLV